MKKVFLTFLTACAAIVMTPACPAEMAPEFYARMQDAAPERLRIRVQSVRSGAPAGDPIVSVEVTARVATVERSQSRLRPGSVILIRYEHDGRRLAGPRPVPILEAGKSYPAFLARAAAGGYYEPAARGASFEECRR